MDFNKACEKITKYLDSASSTPIIVDVADIPGLDLLQDTFKIGANDFYNSSHYCPVKVD